MSLPPEPSQNAETTPTPTLTRAEPLWRWIAGIIAVGIGAIMLFFAEWIIAFGSVELTRGTEYQKLAHHGLRTALYLVLCGVAIWLVRRFVPREQRRKYWIGLGIFTVLLISPAGIPILIMATLLVFSATTR
jgi:chromate transport protein ChrA